MENKKVERNGIVYGFSIAALVLLCINVFVGFIVGAVEQAAIASLNDYNGGQVIPDDSEKIIMTVLMVEQFYVAAMSIGGIVTMSVFISRYKKLGYEMKGQLAFAIVFIVFAVVGGWGIFALVTGILGIIFRKKPEQN